MKKLGLIVPNYSNSGGVKTVADFIRNNLDQTFWEVEIINIPISYRDTFSRNMTRPKSWFIHPVVNKSKTADHLIFTVGSNCSEIEPFRYQPRKVLDDLLLKYDLIQIVAGTPSWALLTKNIERPTCLQIATLTHIERGAKQKYYNGIVGWWRYLMTLVIKKYDRSGLKIADAVFVENSWMEKLMVKLGYSKKTYFTPPGIDSSLYKPERKNNNAPYLLCIGRLSDPRKDVKTLFKAFKLYKDSCRINTKLVLAGKNLPSKKDIEYAKNIGIFDSLVLKKDVTQEKLISLYQNASLFILTSKEEGLGMVILESMGCGTPVISTDSGGPSTIIENGKDGFIVDIGDSEAIAQIAKRLMENEAELKNFSDKARKKVLEKFDAKKNIQSFENVYKELLGIN